METLFFEELLNLANKALANKDIPVGAIIIDEHNQVVSQSFNNRIKTKTISGHAEINAINEACVTLDTLNLSNCRIISTLEPCGMCYDAIRQAKIKEIEYLVDNSKNEVTRSFALNNDSISFKKVGTKQQEQIYQQKLTDFFEIELREK